MRKSDKIVLLASIVTFVVALLFLLDVTHVSKIHGDWDFLNPLALRWPPFIGGRYVIISEKLLAGFSWALIVSGMALIISALWFAVMSLKRKVVGYRSLHQVK